MSQVLLTLLSVTLICVDGWAVREDLLFHRISNRLTGSLLCVGLALRTLDGGWSGLEQSLLGVLVGLGCLLPFYIARAMGAGDVKLLAATGALLGPHDTFIAGICTLFVGAALAFMYLTAGAVRALASAPASSSLVTRMVLAHLRIKEVRRERMPYALAIALGSLASISLSGELAQALIPIWGRA